MSKNRKKKKNEYVERNKNKNDLIMRWRNQNQNANSPKTPVTSANTHGSWFRAGETKTKPPNTWFRAGETETKPFGFEPLKPLPGVKAGGWCLVRKVRWGLG